jgi:cysteine desulfurase
MDYIYFDNAASTPLRKEVKEYMLELMDGAYGNPSSTHAQGRKAKVILESSRKSIAKNLNCLPAEIVFCSGGTEADNAAISLAISDLGVQRILTSPLEHHAVLHAAERWAQHFNISVEIVAVDEKGRIDLEALETKLANGPKTLVSLMHGNNEIGNLLDLEKVGNLCREHEAYFHSDTVQTLGHFPMSLKNLPVDFATASSHKFHGPKGVGFLYIDRRVKVSSFITGGAQERGLRGGTESIIQIGGLARALELACADMDQDRAYILDLKRRFWEGLKALFPKAYTNGLSGEYDESLYTVLSVSIPELAQDSMLLFNLDLKGIAVSGGSACSSGSVQKSHVIAAMNPQHEDSVLRFSFSRNNTVEEVQKVLDVLKEMKAKL